ncbi:hypothetical protein PI125_g8240 [Phytophthora idaei]|nr:hypothetical protein PI125_g8240 [Phytophthora idaei]
MADEESDVVSVLTEAFLNHGKLLSEVRREVFQLLVEEAWKIAMRSRHYITTQCLDSPTDSSWMVLYKYGNDVNFLNTTNLSWCDPSELANLVEAREPLLKHTFGFIDGKNLRVQQASNSDLQIAMYNGWLHTVFLTGTICFEADGCIIWCKHNCPGSWNDSDTSLGFRNKLLDPAFCPDTRMNVVSDSAFPCSSAVAGRILMPLKDGVLESILPSLRSAARTLHNYHVGTAGGRVADGERWQGVQPPQPPFAV